MQPEEPTTGQELRASDSERDLAMDRLRDAAGSGRLTLEELSDRIDAALGAKTRGELERIVADLPVERTTTPEPTRTRRTFLGIMGGDTIREFDEPPPSDDAPVIHIRSFNLMGGNTIRPAKRRRV